MDRRLKGPEGTRVASKKCYKGPSQGSRADLLVFQVELKHLDKEVDQTEVVHTKFVLGSDGEYSTPASCSSILTSFPGAHSWVRNTLGIQMEGDVTGTFRSKLSR